MNQPDPYVTERLPVYRYGDQREHWTSIAVKLREEPPFVVAPGTPKGMTSVQFRQHRYDCMNTTRNQLQKLQRKLMTEGGYVASFSTVKQKEQRSHGLVRLTTITFRDSCAHTDTDVSGHDFVMDANVLNNAFTDAFSNGKPIEIFARVPSLPALVRALDGCRDIWQRYSPLPEIIGSDADVGLMNVPICNEALEFRYIPSSAWKKHELLHADQCDQIREDTLRPLQSLLGSKGTDVSTLEQSIALHGSRKALICTRDILLRDGIDPESEAIRLLNDKIGADEERLGRLGRLYTPDARQHSFPAVIRGLGKKVDPNEPLE